MDADPLAPARTRFAPSPTGYLHVGTARTALFSYLYARRTGGRFILRIEDTDAERNVAGGAEAIVDALRWLGLRWDEGFAVGGPNAPYVQGERLPRYQAAVAAMVRVGVAYPCYCTPEELEERRRAAEAAGRPPGYDGHCRRLTVEQVGALETEGRRPAFRFRMPDAGVTVVEDLIRGRVEFPNATLTDFVILRASGVPTYLLSAAYDDVDMGVTHVIRGEDLLASTPRQVHVFRALGRPDPPAFAHLPLLVGPDRRKLSKRRGQVALEEFRRQGFLPEAMVNYLALLGWSLDDHTEHFSLAELEGSFSLDRVSHNPAAFDPKKLEALNGWWLRQLDPRDLAARALPFVRAAGYPAADLGRLAAVAPLVQERVTRLDEVPDMVGFLFGDDLEPVPADIERVFGTADRGAEAGAFLAAAAGALQGVPSWEPTEIEATLRGLAAQRGLGATKAFQPVRLAVTGRLVSPPLFESLALLGRERSLARLRAALAWMPA